MKHRGCLRPVLLGLLVVVLFLVGLGILNRDVVRLMWSNARSMGEGADLAATLDAPDDLLDALRTGRLRGSLVVADSAGRVVEAVAPDSLRSLVGVTRLVLVSRLLASVGRGEVALDSKVAAREIEALRLRPPSDSGSVLERSETVGQLVERLIGGRDEAIADWMLLRLSPEDPAEETLLSPSVPMVGVWLLGMERDAGRDLSRDMVTAEVLRLTARFRSDSVWRQEQREVFRRRGSGLDVAEQAALARRAFPRGTARGYAGLLRSLVPSSGEIGLAPAGSTGPEAVLSAAGAFPGVISIAACRREHGRAARSVVLLLEDLPTAVFYRIVRTGLDRALVLELLSRGPALP